MTNDNEELRFINEICERTQRFREERGWTQQQMAIALGIPVYRYSKYETRSPLPMWLVPKFCMFVDCTVEEFITGKPRAARARKQAEEQKRA